MTNIEDVISQVEKVLRLRGAVRQAQEIQALNYVRLNRERAEQEKILAKMTGSYSQGDWESMQRYSPGGSKRVDQTTGWRRPTPWLVLLWARLPSWRTIQLILILVGSIVLFMWFFIHSLPTEPWWYTRPEGIYNR